MSEFRIDQIKSQDASRGPDIAGITTFTGTSGIVMPSGDTAYRGGRGRGVMGGGMTPQSNVIQYITISTLGNAIDFGDLLSTERSLGACASSTRGVFGGGYDSTNVMSYVEVSSTGNAFDFGDLVVAIARCGDNGSSNQTRGLFFGGRDPSPLGGTTIQYFTIASKGNASLFGDLNQKRFYSSATSSSTRGFSVGGTYGTPSPFPSINNIEYVTIASTGNANDFGDLTSDDGTGRKLLGSVSNSTRGVFGGGRNTPAYSDIIDYITLASTGNAVDFGNLSAARQHVGGMSSPTRGVFFGGYQPSPAKNDNTIEYITMSTTGNAVDFGDTTSTTDVGGTFSDSHGGLG
jgi:hypothetical protein